MSKRGNLARRICLIGVVLGFGIALWMAEHGSARDEAPMAEVVATPPASPGNAPLSRAAITEMAAVGSEFIPLPGGAMFEANAIDTFDASVRRIVELRFKGLLRSEELNEQRKLLGDSRLLERTAQELIRPKDLPPREDQLRRMGLVTFLTEAISWHDNPSLDVAVSKVKQVVLSENYHLESSPWFRRSLAGDKVELLAAMAEHRPSAFAALVDKARAGRNAKLVEFALRHLGLVGPSDSEGANTQGAISQSP